MAGSGGGSIIKNVPYKVFNRPSGTQRRKLLRHTSPPAEQLLWQHLRGKKINSFKFRRQHGIGNFVVDFYCPKARLAIEIDGPTHIGRDAEEDDEERAQIIKEANIRILRFSNSEIYSEIKAVLTRIKEALAETG